MSLLSTLFGSKKQNAAPAIVPLSPQQINPQAYGDLSTLAHNYTNGIGTGFGDSFVNNATNPVASSMRRNYQNVTAPTISSNYSSRGLGNSSLAANAQGLAEGNVESDIGNLMSQFYTMNEAQKKSDTQFGANLGNSLLGGDVAQQNKQAASSADIQKQTNDNMMYNQQRDAGLAGNILNTGGQGLSMIGSGIGGGGASGGPMSIGGGNSTYGINNVPQGMPNPVQQGTLANISGNGGGIAALLKLFGM